MCNSHECPIISVLHSQGLSHLNPSHYIRSRDQISIVVLLLIRISRNRMVVRYFTNTDWWMAFEVQKVQDILVCFYSKGRVRCDDSGYLPSLFYITFLDLHSRIRNRSVEIVEISNPFLSLINVYPFKNFKAAFSNLAHSKYTGVQF